MIRNLKQAIVRLHRDVQATIDCAAYLLMATILGIGMLVGIAAYREQVVQEFGDIADSLESLDQSYCFKLGDKEFRYDDEGTKDLQATNEQAPAGIQFNEQPTDEKSEDQGGQQP